ncbi:MAG: RluA family pseudouridine synthase [Burkholderiales bacterium]|nr:RluA family pseudouridine synthase [Burkholderiales bacterium]
MSEACKDSVTRVIVTDEDAGQRIDNFLFSHLKGVPKSHVYRILRSGEVRVNSRRIDATYRLKPGDMLRIPPVRVAEKPGATRILPAFDIPILYEDDFLLALDKPAGIAVHGGSGVSFGVIEQLRASRPQAKFLELVHRLDRDTSGTLLLAKKRSALVELHRQIREGDIEKYYFAVVAGKWQNRKQDVNLPLHKYLTGSGERRVSVGEGGMPSRTVFSLIEAGERASLLEANLKTGRTHQIRVHLSHLGFPIIGDEKYGDFALNKEIARSGFRRMYLHAARMIFLHPEGKKMTLESPVPPEFEALLHD